MGVSWNRNDEDELRPHHLAVHLALSFLGWMPLFAVVMFFIWRAK
jgi:hypothetical protein